MKRIGKKKIVKYIKQRFYKFVLQHAEIGRSDEAIFRYLQKYPKDWEFIEPRKEYFERRAKNLIRKTTQIKVGT